MLILKAAPLNGAAFLFCQYVCLMTIARCTHCKRSVYLVRLKPYNDCPCGRPKA